MRWYIVNVYSGFENKVSESIREKASKNGMSEMFGEILIPTEKVVEIKKGERVDSERRFFPGYLLVEMELTDDTWYMVRSISKVSGFLGSKGIPSPISKREVEDILQKVSDSAISACNSVSYEIGDAVKVCDGPFATFNGVIEEVDCEKQRVKVSVSIFGRPTNVDLGFSQIEKIR